MANCISLVPFCRLASLTSSGFREQHSVIRIRSHSIGVSSNKLEQCEIVTGDVMRLSEHTGRADYRVVKRVDNPTGFSQCKEQEGGMNWIGDAVVENSNRRWVCALLFGCFVMVPAADRSDALAAEGFGRYIKRKKLDPLDTYVPTILLARIQIQEVDGKLAGQTPEYADARSLLRSGPASSLRTDMRAVAQYASEAGDESIASQAVDECLSALEDLDSLLLQATRSESASVGKMKVRVASVVTALDKLLTTIPPSILEKGKAVAQAYQETSKSFQDVSS